MTASPDARLTRREVLISGAAMAGYALAAGPVQASAIVTSEEGLVAGSVRLPAGGIELDAYRAHPASGGPFPVVLSCYYIWRGTPTSSSRAPARKTVVCDAPNLYQRQGDPSQLASVDQIISNVVSKVPDAEVMDDLDATLAYAGASGQGDVARAAVTGFCWGGRIVWLYCAHAPKLRCGVAWYGRLVGEPREQTPKHPIDIAATESVPVLGLYGSDDASIPPAAVLAMREQLATGKSGSQIVMFPAAPHGFHADYRDSYRPMAASEAWKRMLTWFRDHGVA